MIAFSKSVLLVDMEPIIMNSEMITKIWWFYLKYNHNKKLDH